MKTTPTKPSPPKAKSTATLKVKKTVTLKAKNTKSRQTKKSKATKFIALEKGNETFHKKALQKRRALKNIEADEKRGVIVLSNIPHGFFESEMERYFRQFGVLENIRLVRSKNSGQSCGYAYIEFQHYEVAQIVAKHMDGYLTFGKIMKCKCIPPAKVTESLFKGKNIRPDNCSKLNRQKGAIRKMNKQRTDTQIKRRISRLKANYSKKVKKLEEMDIDFPLHTLLGIQQQKSEDAVEGQAINGHDATDLQDSKIVLEYGTDEEPDSCEELEDHWKDLATQIMSHLKPAKKSKKTPKKSEDKIKSETSAEKLVLEVDESDDEVVLKTPPNAVKKYVKMGSDSPLTTSSTKRNTITLDTTLTPKSKKGTPKTPTVTPKSKKKTPKSKKETPKTPTFTPESTEGTPKSKKKTPKAPTFTPTLMEETPKTATVAPKFTEETPEQPETTTVTPKSNKKKTPKSKKETPTLMEETPKTATVTPKLTEGTPEQPETATVTPKSKKKTPKSKKGTPNAPTFTLESTEGTPKSKKKTPKAATFTPTLMEETPKTATVTPKSVKMTFKETKITPKFVNASKPTLEEPKTGKTMAINNDLPKTEEVSTARTPRTPKAGKKTPTNEKQTPLIMNLSMENVEDTPTSKKKTTKTKALQVKESLAKSILGEDVTVSFQTTPGKKKEKTHQTPISTQKTTPGTSKSIKNVTPESKATPRKMKISTATPEIGKWVESVTPVNGATPSKKRKSSKVTTPENDLVLSPKTPKKTLTPSGKKAGVKTPKKTPSYKRTSIEDTNHLSKIKVLKAS